VTRPLTPPTESTEHEGLKYLFQFVTDHLPNLPPSSREVTRLECIKACNLVQGELNELTLELIELRAEHARAIQDTAALADAALAAPFVITED
jgi:hypothetical protein